MVVYTLLPMVLLLARFPAVFAARQVFDQGQLHTEVKAQEEKICIGCTKFPKAADYDKTIETTSNDIHHLVENQTENVNNLQDAAQEMQDLWNGIVELLMNLQQGQGCSHMCAVCVPDLKELMRKDLPHLKTMYIQRSKHWQDYAVWPLLGPVDVVGGTVLGAINGLGVGLGSFFLGGSIAGTVAGGMTGVSAANAIGGPLGSAAGNLLGSIAGVSVGAVSGSALLVLTELVSTLYGAYKGVGLMQAATDCHRVGFKRSKDGVAMDEVHPFASEMFKDYGLLKLRHNTSSQNTSDQEALSHCERVKESPFDNRHLSDCVQHSQLCNGPAFIMPTQSEEQCMAMSNVTFLQDVAIALGDAQSALFAQWGRLQDLLKNATGVDGVKLQCISELCSLGGLSKAQENLEVAELEDDERVQLGNRVEFLLKCKADYNLTLDALDERQASCISPPGTWPDLVD